MNVNLWEVEIWADRSLKNVSELERKFERVVKKAKKKTSFWEKFSPFYIRMITFGRLKGYMVDAPRDAFESYLNGARKMRDRGLMEAIMTEEQYTELQGWRRLSNQVEELLAVMKPNRTQGPFR